MEGVSYWDLEIYKSIFGEEENIPIGKMLISKEIELFKQVKNIFYFNDNTIVDDEIIIRISSYKIKGKLAFILLEVIYPKLFKSFLGNL